MSTHLRNSILLVVGLTAIGAVTYLWTSRLPLDNSPGGVFCTMEAKLCPDGSYVGRTGPNCEFSPCPTATTTPAGTTARLQMHIGEIKSTLDVSITPLAVLEDSRCPLDVQCIQAGTVRVRAQLASGLGSAEQIFTLNQPVTTEAETITLVSVSPARYSKQTIATGDYVFTFEITKR